MEQTCTIYQRKQSGPFLTCETALLSMWHGSSTVWPNSDIFPLPQMGHLRDFYCKIIPASSHHLSESRLNRWRHRPVINRGHDLTVCADAYSRAMQNDCKSMYKSNLYAGLNVGISDSRIRFMVFYLILDPTYIQIFYLIYILTVDLTFTNRTEKTSKKPLSSPFMNIPLQSLDDGAFSLILSHKSIPNVPGGWY